MAGKRRRSRSLQTSFNEVLPALSPDGRWLAYVSDETGRSEIYLQPFPGPGGKVRISTDGGTQPLWARDGRELFYYGRDAMMGAKLGESPSLSPGQPQALFRPLQGQLGTNRNWDVAPDGRFLMIEELPSLAAKQPVTVVLNWLQELQQQSPAR